MPYGIGYGYGLGYDMTYIAIVVVSMVLGLLTQWYINSSYKRWSRVPTSFGTTGAEVARRMLDENGASAVGIGHVAGHLSDYFDPRDNNLHLSEENYEEAPSPLSQLPAMRRAMPSRRRAASRSVAFAPPWFRW